ncbi:hypothetical protein B7494_g8404 [Chlorociboria aeruginascens]|nr:hypothetical protein B7494_g8404 [Chlorociboria aeruginascens]
MVLLTMTPLMVEALAKIQSLEKPAQLNESKRDEAQDRDSFMDREPQNLETLDRSRIDTSCATPQRTAEQSSGGASSFKERTENAPSPANEGTNNKAKSCEEPSLASPKIGNPISHVQILNLSTQLKYADLTPWTLEILLRGSKVYISPLTPKAEPTSEYKALMARLRRDEESRVYERMLNPPPPMETFAQRFPASAARAFSDNQYSSNRDDDEVTYSDIDKQMTVILNVVISILACAGALWMVARWWSTPARLALSMSGSLLVGIAEVVVYSGYLKRVGEAKGKEKQLKEVKEVVNTWVVGGGDDQGRNNNELVLVEGRNHSSLGVRERKSTS